MPNEVTKSLSAKIREEKRSKSAIIKEMASMLTKDGDMDDADKSRFDELEASRDDHENRIQRLESVNELAAADADPAEDGEKAFGDAVHTSAPEARTKAFGIGFPKRPKTEKKGSAAARFVIGHGMEMKAKGSGVNFVRDVYEDVAVSKALQATISTGNGGAMIPQDFAHELLELYFANVTVRSSGARTVEMKYGNLTMPRPLTAANSFWGQEGTDIATSQPSFDDLQWSAKRLTAMTPVSNDLINRSPFSASEFLVDSLVANLGLAEDLAFLTGPTGSATTPAGIINQAGASNVFNFFATPTGYSGTALAYANGVLATLEYALRGNNVPMNKAGWIISPQVRAYLGILTDNNGNYFFRDALNQGSLFGYPFKETTQLATNSVGATSSAVTTAASTASTTLTVPSTTAVVGQTVTGTGMTVGATIVSIPNGTSIVVSSPQTVASGVTLTFSTLNATQIVLANFNDVIIGDTMDLAIEVSNTASYWNGSQYLSAFSRNETVYRAIREVDLQIARPYSVAVGNVSGFIPLGNAPMTGFSYPPNTANNGQSAALSTRTV